MSMRKPIAIALVACFASTGCVTVAEHRKLEHEVLQLKQQGAGGAGPERIAELGAQLDQLSQQVASLEGRVEVAEHDAAQAREDAQRVREQAARGALPAPDAAAPPRSAESNAAPPAAGAPPAGEPPAEAGTSPEEVQAYRNARAAWQSGDLGACIDRFRAFLQTYPSSPYADDAAYWMADCHFRQGDYKTALLRFDDVVARYPQGDKSADALYRQGETLLKLGPAYTKAASKAFERVIDEYPNSPRAAEARKQLKLLGSS
jgi:tol-pal system protein YbgF